MHYISFPLSEKKKTDKIHKIRPFETMLPIKILKHRPEKGPGRKFPSTTGN